MCTQVLLFTTILADRHEQWLMDTGHHYAEWNIIDYTMPNKSFEKIKETFLIFVIIFITSKIVISLYTLWVRLFEQ